MSEEIDTVGLATELTVAWLSNSNTRASTEDVPVFLQRMHAAVTALKTPAAGEAEPASEPGRVPAVSVRKSLGRRDAIISLIDGKPYKTLRRHLSGHGLTPEQYRERYNLKADYPMVAPDYSEARRSMAKKIGLGRKKADAAVAAPSEARAASEPAPAKAQRRRGGKLGIAAAKAHLGGE